LPSNSPGPGLTALGRLGLGNRPARAWAMYDWANSAYITIVVTAVFPIYFQKVAAQGLAPATATTRYALATTAALALVALMAPFLGAVGDLYPVKKRMLAAFMGLGVAATAGLAAVRAGDWRLGLALFVLGNVGAYGSFVFYDALLPHVAGRDGVDRLSTAGYALGYLGGGLLLAGVLVAVAHPGLLGLADGAAASRAGFLAVALWWAAFTVPLLRRVAEPPVKDTEPGTRRGAGPVRGALAQLRGTLRELVGYRQAALFLLAFLIYNDGIVTIIRMATVYGAEIGLGSGAMIGAVLMVQFVGIPFAFLFGWVAGRVGTKRAITGGLVVYGGIALLGYAMTSAAHFFLLAGLVAMVQGGTQALSRSLFASMIPAARSAEFFAFFAVCEKAASILGPATFTLATLLTGSSRAAVLAMAAFFAVGALLLARVDVERGRAHAAAAGGGGTQGG
jgi:UMF1 family MFS transporter